MEKRNWYIYEIKNLLNGKTYIGQKQLPDDKTPETDNYFGSGIYIKRAIKKYGINNFLKTIIVFGYFTKEEINEYERYYISLYRLGGKAEYNIADGGNGGNLGKLVNQKISESLKNNDKLSKGLKGRKFSDEHKKKLSESKKGKKGHIWSENQRQIMSEKMSGKNNPMYGKSLSVESKEKRKISMKAKMTPEYIEKIKQSHIGKHHSEETKQKLRLINLGENNPMFGKHLSEETKHKIGKSVKRRKDSNETKIRKSNATKNFWANEKNRKERSEKIKLWWAKRKELSAA